MTPGPLIVISGPSGSGKSTLVRRLLAQPPGPLRLSVSVTTRKPRAQERDGVDYHYWNAERVKDEIARGGFLEWAEVFGNYYGTLVSEVEPFRMEGVGVLLEIDVCGWAQVKNKCADAVSIFIRTRRSTCLKTASAGAKAKPKRTSSAAWPGRVWNSRGSASITTKSSMTIWTTPSAK